MFYDNDADLSLLDGKTVAILGYGSQGHAHALNLKDSGVDVVVGPAATDSSSVEQAKADGPRGAPTSPTPPARGDVVMVLLPDEKHGEVWESEIRDGIAPGNLLLFGHGFSIHYGEIEPGRRGRRRAGRAEGPRPPRPPPVRGGHAACPACRVHQDASGNGAGRSRSPTRKGIGCTRGGVIETTFKDETETDLFGEQAVLCGGVTELVQRRLRDARRRRLRPAPGVLRVPARAEADRRPDVREGHHRHALLDLQHRRVRRPHARQADHLRADPRRR